MNTSTTLQPLLVVQSRRVDRAMVELRASNEALRQRTLERDVAWNHWTDALEACSRHQRDRALVVSECLHQGMAAGGLASASRRGEWLRERADALCNLLRSAQTAPAEAEAVVVEARRLYHRVLAQHEALSMVAERSRQAQAELRLRSEEAVVDDLISCGGSDSR